MGVAQDDVRSDPGYYAGVEECLKGGRVAPSECKRLYGNVDEGFGTVPILLIVGGALLFAEVSWYLATRD